MLATGRKGLTRPVKVQRWHDLTTTTKAAQQNPAWPRDETAVLPRVHLYNTWETLCSVEMIEMIELDVS